MQRLLSVLLVLSFLAQSSLRTAWALHYQWNRAQYIARCENKAEQNLHCDGKCYLKKKMAASELENSKEPQLPKRFFEVKDLLLFFAPAHNLHYVAENVSSRNQFPECRTILPDAPSGAVFRPPAA